MKKRLLLFLALLLSFFTKAQVDEDQLGGWYMYFWNAKFGDSQFGMQGDVQLRTWNGGNDLEQLLLRGGFTYTPKNANVLLTLGYGHITTGAPGESTDKVYESRIYQEALLPHKVGSRIYLKHRFRYEQRWVEGWDFRTRYRYNLFVNVALNQTDLSEGAVYLALYNELFMNGQTQVADRSVEYFDRNRFYSAIGYSLKTNLKVQLGYMQQTTNTWSKGQFQISLHHNFNL